MKKAILAVIVGTVASVTTFAGPANELIKQIARSEEVAAANAVASKMSRKGLEAQAEMAALVKNSKKELVAESEGFTAALKVSDNGQRGILHTMSVDKQGNTVRTALPISEASTVPTDTSIAQYGYSTIVNREFETAAGKIEVQQMFQTGHKSAGYAFQEEFIITTPTFTAEARTVGTRLSGGGTLTGVSLHFAPAFGKPVGKTIFAPEGFFVHQAKINSTGTKLTMLASSGSEVKEFTYPLTVSYKKETIEYGKVSVRTLSASEAKQLMTQVQYIAARKSTSAPVRGMQIETSANVAK